jgi:hypothetical protein
MITTRNPLEHAVADPKSVAKAIKATCYDCVGRGEEDGTMREIATCTSWGCPLWQLRPYQKQAPEDFGHAQRQQVIAQYPPKSKQATAAASPKNRLKALRAFCWDCMGGDLPSTPGVLELVYNCTAQFPNPQPSGYCGCPLWPRRQQPKKKQQTT